MGRLCRSVMIREWVSGLDSQLHPAGYDFKPISLEELGVCDPTVEPNLTDVREWARVAMGLAAPPPFDPPPPRYETEWIDEDKWEERIAELEAQGWVWRPRTELEARETAQSLNESDPE